MALKVKHKKVEFGVGDTIKVIQTIKEGKKVRTQGFEGIVISIKGRGDNKSFTVRKMGVSQIGIERIFPLASPFIESIEVVRKGLGGVRRSKLYYIREKPKKEIEKIYSRASRREIAIKGAKKTKAPVKPRKRKGKSASK